jgi:co-chaperonin GroES (HSP10)
MKPLHNKVIVERIPGETVTESGIVLHRSNEVDRAKIIAVGPDVKEVSVGEIVLLDWNKTVKAGEYFVITEDNIVFVYEE